MEVLGKMELPKGKYNIGSSENGVIQIKYMNKSNSH